MGVIATKYTPVEPKPKVELSKKPTPKKRRVLFIGNPGAGKSTILNCICECPGQFSAGYCIGPGLTTKTQWLCRTDLPVCYGDTPGLQDVATRQQAAGEISYGLQSNGHFLVLFVLTLNNKRVNPDDKAAMKVVLQAIMEKVKDPQYGIIVNQIGTTFYQMLKSYDEEFSKLRIYLLSNLPTPTKFIYLMPVFSDLVEANNKIIRLPPEFYQWIETVPEVHLAGCGLIEADGWEEIRAKFEQELKKLNDDVTARGVAAGEIHQKLLEKERRLSSEYENLLAKSEEQVNQLSSVNANLKTRLEEQQKKSGEMENQLRQQHARVAELEKCSCAIC